MTLSEKIMQTACDEICKFPNMYAYECKRDPDYLMDNICKDCQLEKVLKRYLDEVED